MASKKQKDEIKDINKRLEDIQIQSSHDLGVIATANQAILGGTESLIAEIEASCKGKNIDLSSIPALPDGAGLAWSEKWLTSKGYDTSIITLEDLLCSEEIASIELEINRPLVERLKWDRWDYIFAFGAAIMGSVADFLWGDPRKGLSHYLSNNETMVGGWMEKIHSLHHDGSPLDHKGDGVGGPNHRLMSIGHDLFGFLEGIWQIKNGTFRGIRYSYGKPHKIITAYLNNDSYYAKMDWGEAIWHYIVHVFCDFFSSKSLPIPGFGYLARMPVRDIRKLAANLYGAKDSYGNCAGYNLRHMFVQGLSVGIVELITRTYNYLKYYQDDVQENSKILKRREMALLSHSIVTAVNLGKVTFSSEAFPLNLLKLNLPQILFTCYQFWPVIITNYRRNNRIQIILRNLDEISDESATRYLDSISSVLSSDNFGELLHSNPIIL